MIRFAAIADDYTGGSDLAGMLFEQGVRTVQTFGVPEEAFVPVGCDAIVVCVKTRSIEPRDACRIALEAFDRIASWSPAQLQFKYCSTFDSTPRGNIGPVTEALMTRLGVPFTIAVPALPVNGRTQYLGHLFVNGQPLSESPMRHHPLNPMSDSNLVRWLQQQTQRRVGLVGLDTVLDGPAAIGREYDRLEQQGIEIALVDVVADRDLNAIAQASERLPLITGGSGLGMKLPALWRLESNSRPPLPRTAPATLILAGSCSAATLRQLETFQSLHPVEHLNPEALQRNAEDETDRLVRYARAQLAQSGVAAIRSSAPEEQRHRGAEAVIEHAFGEIARRLAAAGAFGRLIVAGGETSGSVVNALGVRAAELTAIIDPGVPSLLSCGEPPTALALKSGNFGSADFFEKTIRIWEQQNRA